MEAQENGSSDEIRSDEECTSDSGIACSRFDSIKVTDEVSLTNMRLVRETCKGVDRMLCQLPSFGKRDFSDVCISRARAALEDCCMNAIKAISFEGKEVI